MLTQTSIFSASFNTHPIFSSIFIHIPTPSSQPSRHLPSLQCRFGLFLREVQGLDALRATAGWDEAAGGFGDPMLFAIREAPALETMDAIGGAMWCDVVPV